MSGDSARTHPCGRQADPTLGRAPTSTGGGDLVVIVYQPGSGVTWQTMTTVLKGTGTVTSVSGVGDKAMAGAVELDAQAGSRLVAIQGAGGTLTGDYSAAAAIAKAVIAALH
jgi:hypothetical protein